MRKRVAWKVAMRAFDYWDFVEDFVTWRTPWYKKHTLTLALRRSRRRFLCGPTSSVK